jgi:hypothetical protein
MAKSVLTLTLLVLMSPLSHAGLELEPYLAAGTGNWAQNRSEGALEMQLKGNTGNIAYGARLIYSFSYVFVGLDWQYNEGLWHYTKMPGYTFDDDWNVNAKAIETGAGGVIGFKNPSNTFFIWYSLFPGDRLKFSADLDPSEPAPTYQGTSSNVGAETALTHHLSLGVQYQSKTFSRMNQSGHYIGLPGTSAGGSNFTKLNYTTWLVFVSFPLSLI